jgi:membrane protein YdbS with pleckstrin-like domain
MSRRPNNTTQAARRGVSFFALLALLFIGLKLAGEINWPWWWVLVPIWAPITLVVVVIVLVLLFVALAGGLERAMYRQ